MSINCKISHQETMYENQLLGRHLTGFLTSNSSTTFPLSKTKKETYLFSKHNTLLQPTIIRTTIKAAVFSELELAPPQLGQSPHTVSQKLMELPTLLPHTAANTVAAHMHMVIN